MSIAHILAKPAIPSQSPRASRDRPRHALSDAAAAGPVAAVVEGISGSRADGPKPMIGNRRLCSLADLAGCRRRWASSLCPGRAMARLGVAASPVHPVARQRLVRAAALRRPGVLLLLGTTAPATPCAGSGRRTRCTIRLTNSTSRPPTAWAGSVASPERRSSSRHWCCWASRRRRC